MENTNENSQESEVLRYPKRDVSSEGCMEGERGKRVISRLNFPVHLLNNEDRADNNQLDL